MAGDGRAFTTKMKTEIGDSGIQDIWEDYINSNWGIMEAEQEAGITRRMGKSRKTMHLPVNEWGEPIVPDVDLVAESGEVPAEFSGLRDYFQTMLRTFLSMHWGLAGPVTAKDPTVPWSDIIKDPRQYICSEYLPDDMVGLFKDPSKVPIGDCLALLSFWLARQRAGEDVVFEFLHWQKSRYKAPVPREPRREAPEIPAKPGYQHVESSESSEDETEERQTRSSTAKGGKRKADSGGKRSLVKLQESDGDSEEDDSADDEEWRVQMMMNGVVCQKMKTPFHLVPKAALSAGTLVARLGKICLKARRNRVRLSHRSLTSAARAKTTQKARPKARWMRMKHFHQH